MLDYAAWLHRAAQFVEERRKLPGIVRVNCQTSPPLSKLEIEDLAKLARLPIPAQLRRFWAQAACGCKCTYEWEPPSEFERQIQIAFPSWSSGNAMVMGGVEMDEPAEVVELLESCTDWAESFRHEHPKDARIWEHSIPLFRVGNGDHVGLYVRDAPDNPAVAYICHEGYGGSKIIAPSFDDFLIKWEGLGYICIDWLMEFVDRRTELLEPANFPIECAAMTASLGGVVLSDLSLPQREFTQRDWSELKQPELMIEWLEKAGRIEERKFRLFCCACCRRVWDRLGKSGQTAVEVAERYADGLATAAELSAAREAWAGSIPNIGIGIKDLWNAPSDAPQGYYEALLAPIFASAKFSQSEGIMHRSAGNAVSESNSWTSITWDINQHLDEPDLSLEKAAQCDLLRHIYGNPFQPPNAVLHFSRSTRALADQFYSGAHCRGELIAALESEGHVEIAKHFRDSDHPKGCWALELIMRPIKQTNPG